MEPRVGEARGAEAGRDAVGRARPQGTEKARPFQSSVGLENGDRGGATQHEAAE